MLMQIRNTNMLSVVRGLAIPALALFIIKHNVYSKTPDEYLGRAFDRIERTLTTVPHSFGLEIVDSYELPTSPAFERTGKKREGFGIYVSGQQVQFRRVAFEAEKFEPNPDDPEPYRTTVEVFTGPDKPRVAASNIRGTRTLTKQLKGNIFSFGAVSHYLFSLDPTENQKHPERSPFQILENPCLAPLEMTPATLCSWSIQPLNTDKGLKAYEATGSHPDYTETPAILKLYFSTDHDDALTKTELSIRDTEGREYLREVRTVKEWQQTPKGILIPKRFTYVQEMNGVVQIRLTRTISSAVIGDVSENRFDITKIPEFQVEFDRVDDLPLLREQAKQAKAKKRANEED